MAHSSNPNTKSIKLSSSDNNQPSGSRKQLFFHNLKECCLIKNEYASWCSIIVCIYDTRCQDYILLLIVACEGVPMDTLQNNLWLQLGMG
jgi:hypothetical protein